MYQPTKPLEELIESHLKEKEGEFEARHALNRMESIAQMKEKERNRILQEQKALVQSIESFKQLLVNRIKLGDLKSDTYQTVLAAFSKGSLPTVDKNTPFYQQLGIRDEDFNHLLELGKELLKSGVDSNPLDFYTVLSFLAQNEFEVWIGLSRAYFLSKKFDESISCACKAQSINPKNLLPLFCYIECLESQEKWDEAHHIAESLLSLNGELNPSSLKFIHHHLSTLSRYRTRGGIK